MVDAADPLAVPSEARRHGDRPGSGGVLRLGSTTLALLDPARVYVCGITPYDVTHLGHAATFVWTDVLVRVIRSTGVGVRTCRNVTDVDDVLTRASLQRGRRYDEYAATQEFLFDRTMKQLRVSAPTHSPRAGAHVHQVVQLAQAMLGNGSAYEREGRVFFRGAGVADRAGVEPATALALLEEYGDDPSDPVRDDPSDVALWLPSGEEDPAWASPWGPGRPGWHAECAAMALSVLGAGVDVLAGGADLAFPHHAYQSAMAAAFNGSGGFARARFPVGQVHLDGAKMAKSTGNLVLADDLLADVAPEALRLLLLDRPWAQPWEFVRADLDRAGERLERLHAAATRPAAGSGADSGAATAALLADLDVPSALDHAEAEGGTSARSLLRVLALDQPED